MRRETLYVHFNAPRFIRIVGDPVPVRRECTAVFHRWCLQVRKRFAFTTGRQYVDIVVGLWINLPVQQETPVSRPVQWELGLLRSEQQPSSHWTGRETG